MKWQENKRRQNEITRYTNPIRGKIIDGVINVESNIDVYLALHFTNNQDRENEIIDLLFSCSSPSMPFENKRALLVNIFKTKGKTAHDDNKNFFEDLSFIIKHRNVFAHYLLNNGSTHFEEFDKTKTIYFLKYKLVTEEVDYSPEFIKEILGKIEDCIKYSNAMVWELMNRK